MGVNHSQVVAKYMIYACDNKTTGQVSLTTLDTPIFHEYLRKFLKDLTKSQLPKDLEAVLNSYVTLKPRLAFKWHPFIDAEKWIREPSSILDTLPPVPPGPSKNLIVNRLFQGLSLSDPIIRRIWIVQFSNFRNAVADRFFSKGHSHPIIQFITDPTRNTSGIMRLSNDSAYLARRLDILQKKHPALLVVSVDDNNDYETTMPVDEERLQDAVYQVSSMVGSEKYAEAVNAVSNFLEAEWMRWLEPLAREAKTLEQRQRGSRRKRSDGRVSVLYALTIQDLFSVAAMSQSTMSQSTPSTSFSGNVAPIGSTRPGTDKPGGTSSFFAVALNPGGFRNDSGFGREDKAPVK